MSETTATTTAPVTPTPVPPTGGTTTTTQTGGAQPDSLYSQAFIYAMCLLPIGAGILVCAFKYLSPEVASTLAGTALALVLGNPSQFFFGAAKHAANQAPAAPTTTTSTTQP